MSVEEWRTVPGFPDYEVSDQGRIVSHRRATPRLLAPTPTVDGLHLRVNLATTDGRYRTKLVHRLVGAAFLGAAPEGKVTRHLNGDGHDNRLQNLTYGTYAENSQDAVAHGTHNMARRTHCQRGHEYTPENTGIRSDGGRLCRRCRQIKNRDYYARTHPADLVGA